MGSGISGLVCAHLLDPVHDVTLLEAGPRLGGHTNTVDIELPAVGGGVEHHAVDTGFIVFNERNYPNFIKFLDRLGVASQPSEMSFSVACERSGVEYRGSNLNTLYAQRSNLLRGSFHRMLLDIVRFNRSAQRLLAEGDESLESLAEFVDRGRYSTRFRDEFLIPLGAAIWSADPRTFLDFPAGTYARFMDNHGLLGVRGIPPWRTVTGGARQYVRALTAQLRGTVRTNAGVLKIIRSVDPTAPLGSTVEVVTADGGSETYDAVVLALHADDALALLGDAGEAETSVLGALRYQPNVATLHTDRALLPRAPRARASWNYHLGVGDGSEATLTYWMNNLQGLQSAHDILVTLNRADDIDPDRVLAQFEYAHPVFDGPAVAAQRRRDEIQGRSGTYFAGAYWGYGFHEDGVNSALDVCRRFGVDL